MRFGPKKGHPISIFENIIGDFGPLILSLILILVMGKTEEIYNFAVLLVIFIVQPISKFMGYLTTTYAIDDEKLHIKKGVFVKKEVEVPLANILNIDISQPFLYQIFGVSKLNVENASSMDITSDSGKIKMAFKNKEAIYVRDILLERKNIQNDKYEYTSEVDVSIKAGTKEILLMGLLKMNPLYAFNILVSVVFLSSAVLSILGGEAIDESQIVLDFLQNIKGYTMVALMVVVFFIIGILGSFITNTIRFYGFNIKDNGNSIFVEYGLFNKNTHTILKEKVSGISFKQPFLMKPFGVGFIEIYAIGYGTVDMESNSPEIALLYPLIKENELRNFVKNIMPDFDVRGETEGVDKKSLRYFFITGRFIFTLLLCIFALALPYFLEIEPLYIEILRGLSFVMFICAFISVILEYKNAGVAIKNDEFILSNGSFVKNKMFIKMTSVEYLRERSTVFKKKHGFTTIEAGILAPMGNCVHKVKNIKNTEFNSFVDKLDY